jgi:hypothetical protein
VKAKLFYRGGCLFAAMEDHLCALEALHEAHRLQPKDQLIAKKLKEIKG